MSVVRLLAPLVVSIMAATPCAAELSARSGFRSSPLFNTAGSFALLEGLDVAGNQALLGFGTQVRSLDLETGATNVVGTLPANVSVAFVKARAGDVHAAYGTSFNFPFPARHGVFDGGAWMDLGAMDGLYDAAVDNGGNLYLMANPGGAGSRVYRYDTATTSLVLVIQVGGFSGGLAFDSQDRLYVADQNNGHVLRYTPTQLATGNLTAASGEVFVPGLFASYLCLDEHDRLVAVSGFGNRLTVHRAGTGVLEREIAVDGAGGFGIGRIAWDPVRNQLLAVHSDYSVFASTLESITYSASGEGIAGTSSVIRGWAAAYQDLVQPDAESGGYMLNNAGEPGSPADAVLGRPVSFDPDEFPIGHILSLGNGGSITLMFEEVIVDGPGADFVVFENAFDFGSLTFSEFAFIDVATTTNAWARFPVTYHDTNAPGIFKGSDATRVDGLAGKHTLAYGTPFDLAWLKHDTNVISGAVDLDHIAYVRVTDAVGDGSTFDQFGRPIHDPYNATTSLTDGFDLRGVGVIHAGGLTSEPVDAGSVALSWFGYPGRLYQLQSGTGTAWQDYGSPVGGTGGVHRIELPASSGDIRMFRIIQTIPVAP